MKLGIMPIFIHPASPQENGRDERMHRTLKKQTSNPPANNRRQQQARFDAFRRHYNEERPHEALGQRPPAEVYVPSPRAMRLASKTLGTTPITRSAASAATARSNQRSYIFIGEALVDELIGIVELETGDHVVRFCDMDIGLINRRGLFIRFAPPREGLRDPAEQTAQPNLSGIMPV